MAAEPGDRMILNGRGIGRQKTGEDKRIWAQSFNSF